MAVRFILGRSGTGKTAACMEEVRGKIRDNPSGAPLIYLVPEHMTFSTEYSLAATPGFNGLTRLNVYSFSRLALRVLQTEGGITRIRLDQTGIAMILRQIVMEKRGQFRVFRRAAEQTGFFRLLSDSLSEFKRYCLSPDFVRGQAQADGSEDEATRSAEDKLHDLAIIYQAFDEKVQDKYIDGDETLKVLAEKIPDAAFLKEAEIWIDGFQSMTPQEQLVVENLMETAAHVTIAIGCDRIYQQAPNPFSPFHHPALLFLNLKERAESAAVAIEPIVVKTTILRSRSEALIQLNRAFGLFSAGPVQNTDGLSLTEAVNKREEVEQAARRILDLVRAHRYRFREITVLTRQLADYKDLIETVFSDYGIPVFIDQKKAMVHHPLIECIRSALETFQQNWRYEPVFRCVKTDFFLPVGEKTETEREHFDRLENYVLAHGIYGRKKWLEKDPWPCRPYHGLEEEQPGRAAEDRALSRELHRARLLISRPLAALEQSLRDSETVRGKCEAVYRFLLDLSVPQKLTRLAETAQRQDRLQDVREHRQVWNGLLNLLDQCVEGAGSGPLDFDLFCDMLDTGLEQLEFAFVPPALDQVQITGLERLRASNWRAVFLLGVNEGILPARPAAPGLLSDEDRSGLEEKGFHLSDSSEQQMAAENGLIYRALTLPSEKLFLSYPLAAEEGESLKASPLIERVRRLFPRLNTIQAPSEPRGLSEAEQLDFINVPRRSLSYLTTQIREWQRGYPISDIWWDVYNWMIAHKEWSDASSNVLAGLSASNHERLSPETARDLYGPVIQGSVSRLEQFNACPFAQFVSYGLRLKERELFQLTAPDIGQLFHLAMKQMTGQMIREKKNWSELSDQACDQLAAETVSRLAPRLQRQILSSSGRYRYLQHKLMQIVARVARVLHRQAESSGFVPLSLELPFGPGRPLPPLSCTLENGSAMQIAGRIDRVDKAEKDGRLLLRIVDYKSSGRDLDLNDVYYGLALQMLTYLDVVITYSEQLIGRKAEPAGVLYFHIHNPFLRLSEQTSPEQIENEWLKQFRMKGLLLEDSDALLLSDEHGFGKRSLIAPFGLTKDEKIYKGSSVASTDQFSALRNYTRETMKKSGKEISEGDISVAPYRLRQRVACTFCPFRPVCLFDQSQPGCEYRELTEKAPQQLLQMIEEETGKS